MPDPDGTFRDSIGVEFSQRVETELGTAAEAVTGRAGTMVPCEHHRALQYLRAWFQPQIGVANRLGALPCASGRIPIPIDNFPRPMARSLLPVNSARYPAGRGASIG